MSTEEQIIIWDTRFPLLTNRYFMWDMIRVLGIASTILLALMVVIMGDVVMAIQFAGLVGVIMLGVMSIACLLLGNGFDARFSVGQNGISYESGSTGKKWNKAALVLGVLAGKPGTAGAGALAMSGEAGSYEWKEIVKITVDEKRRIISLHNSWRTLNRLYCLEGNFDPVLQVFRSKLDSAKIVMK
jgi:hypothetical protein